MITDSVRLPTLVLVILFYTKCVALPEEVTEQLISAERTSLGVYQSVEYFRTLSGAGVTQSLIAIDYWLGHRVRGSDFRRRGLGLFLFSTASRPALSPRSLLPNGYRRLSPGVKRPGREADHSLPSVEVKNAWRYSSTPSTSSWRGA
jgi:hypothetical protein